MWSVCSPALLVGPVPPVARAQTCHKLIANFTSCVHRKKEGHIQPYPPPPSPLPRARFLIVNEEYSNKIQHGIEIRIKEIRNIINHLFNGQNQTARRISWHQCGRLRHPKLLQVHWNQNFIAHIWALRPTCRTDSEYLSQNRCHIPPNPRVALRPDL
jgi:hypothetical protein